MTLTWQWLFSVLKYFLNETYRTTLAEEGSNLSHELHFDMSINLDSFIDSSRDVDQQLTSTIPTIKAEKVEE